MLVAALCVAWAAPADAAETLGAMNVVTGSQTGYVDVEIPRDVTVRLDNDPKDATTFSVTGSGAFYGVALVQLGRDEYPGMAMAGRFDPSLTCDGTDCRDDLLTSAGQSTGYQPVFDPREATLAKGRYRLFLISDGAPVRAVIRLGLDGNREFTPSAPVHPHTVAGLQPVDPFPMDHFDIFAGRAVLASHGVILMTARINTVQNTGEVNIEVCNYEGEEPGGVDFYPGCAQDNDHALYYGNTYIAADKPVSVDWAFDLPKGTWRTGGNVVVGGGIESSTWSALWLPTEGPAAPAAPAEPAVTAPATGDTSTAAPRPTTGRLTITSARRRGRAVRLATRCTGGPCRGAIALGRAKVAYDLEAGDRQTLTLKPKRRLRPGKVTATLTEDGAARRVTVRLR